MCFWPKKSTIPLTKSPYSSGMAPCDFFLFPKLKKTFRVHRFVAVELWEVFWRLEEALAQVSNGNYFEAELKIVVSFSNTRRKSEQALARESFLSPRENLYKLGTFLASLKSFGCSLFDRKFRTNFDIWMNLNCKLFRPNCKEEFMLIFICTHTANTK